MIINFMQVVFFIVVFFLSVMTYYNWKLNKKILFLSAFFLIFSFEHLMMGYLFYGTNAVLYSYLFSIFKPLYFIKAPLLYFFVRSIFKSNSKFSKYDYLHFLPAVIKFFDLINYYLTPHSYKLQVANQVLDNFANYDKVELFSFYPQTYDVIFRNLQLIAYVICIFYMLINTYAKKHQPVSTAFKNIRNWVIIVVIIILSISTFNLLIPSISAIFTQHMPDSAAFHRYSYKIGFVIYLLIPFVFATFPKVVYGFTLNDLLHTKMVDRSKNSTKNEFTPIENIEKSEQFTAKNELLYNEIIQLMDSEKPFLVPGFQISDLADKLNYPKHQIQACLNSYKNVKFADFKNEYRIKYACELLKKDKSLSLEGIGIQCGYVSNSNFYAAFRQFTGKTPLQYINEVLD